MRITLAQINVTAGDLDGNAARIVEAVQTAAREGADLVVLPEMSLTGYPPHDLLQRTAFVEATQQALSHVAAHAAPEVGVLIGAPVPNDTGTGKPLYNTARLYEGGALKAEVHKALLPTYDVFDERRYFEPGDATGVVEWRGMRLGIHVCEDMWNEPTWNEPTSHLMSRAADGAQPRRLYDRDPVADLAEEGVDLFINLSAAPYTVGKHADRTRRIEALCREHERPFLLCNLVGASTEVVFDGDSRVHDAQGTLLACAAPFDESLVHVDVSESEREEGEEAPITASAEPARDADRSDLHGLHDTLVTGIRDYVRKTDGFENVLVGLSGGIDSAVTCALAVEALGPEHVLGVTLPSEISLQGSVTDSAELAANLGIGFRGISIAPAMKAFESMLEGTFEGTEAGVTEENLQARARGATLMALSNKFGPLLLATGNKSELAVGYATLYGDMSGSLAPLADVWKTQVYDLARHVNARAGREVIPQSILDKPPSAELRPGQRDTDALPPYEVLDDVLQRYLDRDHDADAIARATGLDADLVVDLLDRVDRAEFKRQQAPPGLRVSTSAFGSGRRMPVTMSWERASTEAVGA